MIFVWAHSLEVARVDFAIPRGLGAPGFGSWKLVRGPRDVVGAYESGRDELVVCHTNGYRLTDEQREALEWCQVRGYNGTASVEHIGPAQPPPARVTFEERDRPEVDGTEYTATAIGPGAYRYTSVTTAPREVNPADVRAQLERQLEAELDRAMIYGDAQLSLNGQPLDVREIDLHVDQQYEPVATVREVVGIDPAMAAAMSVRMRRGPDGHLYRVDDGQPVPPATEPEPVLATAAPPTLTEEEHMAADENADAETRPPDWTEIRITLPPGADVRAVVDSLVATSELEPSDWCEWEGPDGTLASLGPCPPPFAQDHPSG